MKKTNKKSLGNSSAILPECCMKTVQCSDGAHRPLSLQDELLWTGDNENIRNGNGSTPACFWCPRRQWSWYSFPDLTLRPLPLVSIVAPGWVLFNPPFPHFGSSLFAGALHADNGMLSVSQHRRTFTIWPWLACFLLLLSTHTVFLPQATADFDGCPAVLVLWGALTDT